MNKYNLLTLFGYMIVFQLSAKDVLITEVGAKGDNSSMNTIFIQKAIDEVHQSGGGKVIVPAGDFITGTIILKSNVTLYLSEGATLHGSTNLADYPVIYPEFKSYTDVHANRSIIYAEKQNYISIQGKGTIDGHGEHANFSQKGKHNDDSRPYGVRIISCKNIHIEGITLRNAAQWMQHYLNCENLFINNIYVFNHANLNNDGIDIDGCRNVVLTNSIFDADDDAICLKGNGKADNEHITISNCVARSNCNAFKMGTETTGGFKHITANNITIGAASVKSHIWNRKMNMGGIVLEIVDGGHMENIVLSNFTIDSCYSPIFIRLGNRARKHEENAPAPPVGHIKNIKISHVIAHSTRPEGNIIAGIPEHYIENVQFNNIDFFCYGGGKKEHITAEIPEKEDQYPDAIMFGKWLPAYGMYIRHVKNIQFNHVNFYLKQTDERPCISFDDVQNFKLTNVDCNTPKNNPYQFFFKNSKNGYIEQTQQTAEKLSNVKDLKKMDITYDD